MLKNILTIVLVASGFVFSQSFIEKFDYSSGSLVTLSTPNWTSHSGTANQLQVISTASDFGNSLYYSAAYSTYHLSQGNRIQLLGSQSEDVGRNLSASVTTGTLYYSFLLKVTASPTANSYFVHAFEGTSGSTFGGCLWMVTPSSSGFRLGVSVRTTAPVSFTSDLPLNVTHLIVVKYTFVNGTLNDQVDLFVNPEVTGTEPLPTLSAAVPVSTDLANIGRIALRQSTNMGTLEIDEMRVGTTWNAAPLPVELTSFTASSVNGTVNLNWATATEVSNYGFEVERSTDNSVWNKIGFVAGNGNSNSVKTYSYSDNTASAGTVYYRLKQLDTDGKYEYSKVVSVNNTTPDAFTVDQNFPNPFNPSTTIRFSLANSSNVKVDVYASNGELVHTLANQTYEAGNHAINFDASQLSAGIYLYRITAIDATGKTFSAVKKMQLIK